MYGIILIPLYICVVSDRKKDQKMDRQVKKLIKQLLGQLAPDNMPKGELKKLVQVAGLGESTIRNAKHRQGLTADTLLALLLANGVAPEDILHLPRKKLPKTNPLNFKWSQLALQLNEREKVHYMDFILWNKKRFNAK